MKLVLDTDNAGLGFLLFSLFMVYILWRGTDRLATTKSEIQKENVEPRAWSSFERLEEHSKFKGIPKDMDHQKKLCMVTRLLPDPTAECFTPLRLARMEYAVRGEIPQRAAVIAEEIREGKGNYPFKEIIYCNIGNPIQVGYKPLTYIRQIMSAYWAQDASNLPSDLKVKMEYVISCTKPGAYTQSRGHDIFVGMVERFLRDRDGFDCKSNGTSVYLSDGASSVITLMLEYLIDASLSSIKSPIPGEQYSEDVTEGDNTMAVIEEMIKVETGEVTASSTSLRNGVFLPVPQYPLYSATLARFGGHIIPYCLVEDSEWSLPGMDVLDGLYADALRDGVLPRAIVLINPNNPTGSVTGYNALLDLLKFSETRKMVVLADEVYQTNLWGDAPFVSARKVAYENKLKVKLCSFHSTSKGLWGECGARGGFMAMDNFPTHIDKLVEKCVSVRLCPNVTGQVAMAFACHPPVEGDESYPVYQKEVNDAIVGYKLKAETLFNAFKSFTNLHSQRPLGAMYMFPRIDLPQKAIDAAGKANMKPDAFYCLQLLLKTGIVCVPGSGFGQEEGTYHFRITIIPELDILLPAIEKFSEFHEAFMKEHMD